MKSQMKKNRWIAIAPLLLLANTACHIDGNVLLGGQSHQNYDNYYGSVATVSCVDGTFNSTSDSGSTASCQVPDETMILAVTAMPDGSLKIMVKKTAGNVFPGVSLSFAERGTSSPHSVTMSCDASATASVTADVKELTCRPGSNVHAQWYETSSLDIRLQLRELAISDSSCGSKKEFAYSGVYCGYNQPPGYSSTPGMTIGTLYFPDLYLAGSAN